MHAHASALPVGHAAAAQSRARASQRYASREREERGQRQPQQPLRRCKDTLSLVLAATRAAHAHLAAFTLYLPPPQ
eukprot:563263-Pleurochrysis_carterae.AAC.1